jgi:hypothetical protein
MFASSTRIGRRVVVEAEQAQERDLPGRPLLERQAGRGIAQRDAHVECRELDAAARVTR